MRFVQEETRRLWAAQDRHPGDRWRLFRAVGDFLGDRRVLYPGSYVDIAPSFVFGSVTYVDSDRRTPAFFGDEEGILEIIASHRGAPAGPVVEFIHSDYTGPLGLPTESFGGGAGQIRRLPGHDGPARDRPGAEIAQARHA